MRSLSLSAEQILAIVRPELLFDHPEQLKEEHRRLAKLWHPDTGGNTDVFAHISQLYNLAAAKIEAGEWQFVNRIQLTTQSGTEIRVRYRRHTKTELGDLYYGDSYIVHVVDQCNADLFHNSEQAMKFKYRSPKIEKEIKRWLPVIKRSFETKDNRFVHIIEKKPDEFSLQDMLNLYMNGDPMPFETEHVAWILNRLYNLACYFESAEITHNGLIPQNIFLSPEHHNVLLPLGWAYSRPLGARLNAVPAVALDLAPPMILKDKRALPHLDLQMIRWLGRLMLGDESGMNMKCKAPMRKFLLGASKGHAREDFEEWANHVLPACFGKRRFVEWKVKDSDIYKE